VQLQSVEAKSPGLVEIAWAIRRKGALQFFMEQWRAQGDLPWLRMGGTSWSS
jgi:hypothetical protein